MEYQVRASAGDGVKSPWSSVVSAVADPQMAPGPRNIVTHATATGFTVAWDPPLAGGFAGEIDRYGVIFADRDEKGCFPSLVGVRGERAEIKGLVPAHRYDVAVETWTNFGGGPPAGAKSVVVGEGEGDSIHIDLRYA